MHPRRICIQFAYKNLGVGLNDYALLLAEGEGFEPPDLSVNGFQDRRLKPLGHPSVIEC